MFRIGQLVQSNEDPSEAGIVTYVGIDGAWVTVNWEDSGVQVLIPFNCIEPVLNDSGQAIYYG